MMNTYQIVTLLLMFGSFLIALIDFIRKIIKDRKRKEDKNKNNKNNDICLNE